VCGTLYGMESGRGRIWRTTPRRRVVSSLAVTASAVLVLGACSSEDLAERVAEEAVEQQLEAEGEGGDVDIDINDGNVSIQGADGEIQFDVDQENGETVISTPEGQTIIGSGDLPDDFPSDIPVPDGATIASASSVSADEGPSFFISGSLDDEFGDATDAYKAALESAGFEQQSMTESTDGTFFGFISSAWNVTGGIYPDTADGEGSQFGINVFPATP
jgi:hypothetical protein